MELDWRPNQICKSFTCAKYRENQEISVWIIPPNSSGVELSGRDDEGSYGIGFLEFNITTKGFGDVLIECIDYIADDYDRVKTVLTIPGRCITLNTENILNAFVYEGDML